MNGMADARRVCAPLAAFLLAACATQQTPAAGPTPTTAADRVAADPLAPPGLAMIRDSDVRRDLFALAGDEMRGREAGTLDELRASVWLAERAREAGLQPAGDDQTYFQFFSLRRLQQSNTSRIAIGGEALQLWRDVAVMTLTDTTVSAPIVWVENVDSATLAAHDLNGKVAATRVRPIGNLPSPQASLYARRYTTAAVNALSQRLRARGAAAVLLVADSIADSAFDVVAANARRGRYLLDRGEEPRVNPVLPTLLVRAARLPSIAAPGQRLEADLVAASYLYPSVNVVARVAGTDAALRSEYVLFSSHQDHDGVRGSVNGDSIWNGADDNATTSVALLAIGRAFASHPGRRSALFVWHGAEERGLLGSNYHVQDPTVPRASIVAVLNGDMMGRNPADSAALLGVIPPHRNSTALAQMALDANRRITGFAIDSTWDRTEHREGWYFRSDHLPYARAHIPALFFTTLLHGDYHTPLDEPARIDVAKLTRMTKWMYATGWAVATTSARPTIDPGFRLER
jgi:hypothetical protein